MINDVENLKRLYKELYSKISENNHNGIFPFFVQAGSKYPSSDKRCLFVGKSVNGWITNSRDVEELFDMNNDKRIVNRSDQIIWALNRMNSPFWRVIRGVSREIIPDDDWYNYIAWSNLYKLSPCEGNPDGRLQNLQREACIKILNEEIRILKPNCVIFLSSSWERFYLDFIGLDIAKNSKKYWSKHQTQYQVKGDILYIQSPHPQCKNEDAHIRAISEILKAWF